ncbi:MAG: proprotein convertase P-domain-containing protein [Gemmataceae bacterium]
MFDLTFPAQTAAGSYTLKIGPDVADYSGNAMTAYSASYQLASPARITSAVWSGTATGNVTKVRVTFDRAIASATFTAADVVLTNPSGTKITLSGVQVVAGSGDKVFDLTFAAQTAAGNYTLKIGPDVKDYSGVTMTAYSGSYRLVAPPRIVTATWSGTAATNLAKVTVTFDRAITLSTFTTADVVLTSPSGAKITVSGVKVVTGSGDKVFEITFPTQTAVGTYTLKVGPDVKDLSGVAMTTFTTTRSLANPPRIVSAVPGGPAANTLSKVRVTFDRAIATATFTTYDVVLTNPAGGRIAIDSVKVVAGSGDKVFEITFATQTTGGTYSLKVGPDVKDYAGVSMTTYSTTLPINAVRTFATSAAVQVAKGTSGVSLLTVGQSVTIADINVKVNITSPRNSDLVIMLQAPDGTGIVLFNRYGGTSANLIDTVFDDSGKTFIANGIGPYTGSFQPSVPLSSLNGKNAQGTWKLG